MNRARKNAIVVAALITHLACEVSTTATVSVHTKRSADQECLLQVARARFGGQSLSPAKAPFAFAVDVSNDLKQRLFVNVQQRQDSMGHELLVELAWWGEKSADKVARVQLEQLALMRDFLSRCLSDDRLAAQTVQCVRSVGRHRETGCPKSL